MSLDADDELAIRSIVRQELEALAHRVAGALMTPAPPAIDTSDVPDYFLADLGRAVDFIGTADRAMLLKLRDLESTRDPNPREAVLTALAYRYDRYGQLPG